MTETTGHDELSDVALGLRVAVVEVERHASECGWDQPSRLFALVRTTELAAAEPELAAELGISDGTADLFTPVEQELEDACRQRWRSCWAASCGPTLSIGAMAVVERARASPGG